MNTLFVPENPDANVTGSVNVSALPLIAAAPLANAIAHWLFCTVPLLPTTPEVYAVPALFSRFSVFVART
jgi:hypothetical protein